MKKAVQALHERNARVEADKAWETSRTRRAIIAAITYITVVAFLFLIDAPYPWMSAAVPVIGYLLSTLLLGPLKRWWLVRVYRK